MTQNLAYYAKKFVKLRVDKARGVAPHKPILLLTVLNLFEKRQIYRNDQRCAFCNVRVVGWDGLNMVDGAHIQTFAELRDDRFVNGMALCKNHHWAFDHGWFGVYDDYRILIPWDRFTEEAAVKSRGIIGFIRRVD